MHVSVATLPSALPIDDHVTAVVVDILRATSVMVTALEQGAAEVVAFAEIDQARGFAARTLPRPLLCGERFCKPIAGFDMGNSPADYTKAEVSGRTLAMTTTNGTRALAVASAARRVLVGSFLNLSALATSLRYENQIVIVCAGTDGEETEEDLYFAGALATLLFQQAALTTSLCAVAETWSKSWLQIRHDHAGLTDVLCQSRGGRNLVEAGYRADIEACARTDTATSVPEMVQRSPITLRQSHR